MNLVLKKVLTSTIVIAGMLIAIFVISTYGIKASIPLILLPFVVILVLVVFNKPIYGVWLLMMYGFLTGVLTKNSDLPLGTLIDMFLILILIALMVNKSTNWKFFSTFTALLIVIWFIYTILQIFNPISPTYVAWFYASRPLSFQLLLITLFGSVLLDKHTFKTFIKIWIIFSCIAVLDGFRQKFMYPNLWGYEKIWLALGHYKQHVLFGKLRIFSFYTDSGQFGAAMAQITVVSSVLFFNAKKLKNKILYLSASIFTFLGMMISGTRGAMFVLAIGLIMYVIIAKRWKMVILGSILAGGLYYALAHTYIAQDIYEVNRMRTAIRPADDPSFRLRRSNQRKLAIYLKDKPFGNGIGTSAAFGQKFSPDLYVSNIAADSLYVRIWVETGVVGLVLYLLLLMWIIFKGGYLIWNIKDEEEKIQLMAVWSSLIGIFLANYGNMVMTQVPSSILCYLSIGYMIHIEYKFKHNIKTIQHA